MGLLSLLFGKKGGFSWGFKRKQVSSDTERRIQSDWKNIETQLRGGSPSQLRQALITADKALDNALRDLVEGENMGQRLKEAKDLFEWKDYDKLWKAHKMRNSLVHESGYEPTHSMITLAIDDLKKGLKILGVRL